MSIYEKQFKDHAVKYFCGRHKRRVPQEEDIKTTEVDVPLPKNAVKSDAKCQDVRAESGVQRILEIKYFCNVEIDKTGVQNVEGTGSTCQKGGISVFKVKEMDLTESCEQISPSIIERTPNSNQIEGTSVVSLIHIEDGDGTAVERDVFLNFADLLAEGGSAVGGHEINCEKSTAMGDHPDSAPWRLATERL